VFGSGRPMLPLYSFKVLGLIVTTGEVSERP
jgi:hypothetical protein